MYQLYGDGIHDDYPAIQEMLDSRVCEVVLPAPAKCYVISKTLKIHGNQTLKLPRFAVIRLADKANCAMIENEDFENYNENICIDGGIWDMNHNNQWPNPYHFPDENGLYWFGKVGFPHRDVKTYTSFIRGAYTGHCMRFCRIRRFVLKNITIRNPVVYGVQMGYIEDFSVQDIIFDYTEGSPKLWNLDGVHVEGYCKNGSITNLKGACHDDLVALTADDSLYGPIENILVDGIFAEGSHSAVRLLSHGLPIKNVTIRNVFGSYYVYCIGLTKYHGGEEERGVMENIVLENITACACEGTVDVKGGRYPVLWVQKGVDVEGLSITNVHREEKTYPTPLFKVDEGATVKNLRLRDIYQKNKLDTPVPFIQIDGEVEYTAKENLQEL
ncbi:MAG: hypothetical protein E7357_06540 [Clostridiales bacterium]|nr:hypothetical protein [Clostridiales bacterium]